MLCRHLGNAQWRLSVCGPASVGADCQERTGWIQGPCNLCGGLHVLLQVLNTLLLCDVAVCVSQSHPECLTVSLRAYDIAHMHVHATFLHAAWPEDFPASPWKPPSWKNAGKQYCLASHCMPPWGEILEFALCVMSPVYGSLCFYLFFFGSQGFSYSGLFACCRKRASRAASSRACCQTRSTSMPRRRPMLWSPPGEPTALAWSLHRRPSSTPAWATSTLWPSWKTGASPLVCAVTRALQQLHGRHSGNALGHSWYCGMEVYQPQPWKGNSKRHQQFVLEASMFRNILMRIFHAGSVVASGDAILRAHDVSMK